MPAVRPIDFPPPFDSAAVIGPPTDPEDERIEVGILIVGGGPAGLACAIRVGQLLEEHPDVADRLGEVPVAVLEQAAERARIDHSAGEQVRARVLPVLDELVRNIDEPFG
jgi:flavin-dependent dehydrogenase